MNDVIIIKTAIAKFVRTLQHISKRTLSVVVTCSSQIQITILVIAFFTHSSALICFNLMVFANSFTYQLEKYYKYVNYCHFSLKKYLICIF